MTLAYPRSIKQ